MDYPGEKLIIKMWDTLIDKGIGCLLQPWHEKRLAKARIEIKKEEILTIAEAEKIVESIKNKNSVTLLPSNIQEHGIILHLENEKQRRLLEEEINVNKAILLAEKELENDSQTPPQQNVNDDWLYRWKENAGKIGSDELQQLWGKILAGEVKSPGKYSLRSLDFLKNISQHEAKLIAQMAQFNIAGIISRDEENILQRNGISFDNLIFLQELGVLTGVGTIGLTIEFKSSIKNKYQKVLISNGKAILITHDDPKKILSLNIYGVSQLGKEILSLGNFSPNIDYLMSISKRIMKLGFNVKMGDWTQIDMNKGKLLNLKDIPR